MDQKITDFINGLERAGRITYIQRLKLERWFEKIPPKWRKYAVVYIQCDEIALARKRRKNTIERKRN